MEPFLRTTIALLSLFVLLVSPVLSDETSSTPKPDCSRPGPYPKMVSVCCVDCNEQLWSPCHSHNRLQPLSVFFLFFLSLNSLSLKSFNSCAPDIHCTFSLSFFLFFVSFSCFLIVHCAPSFSLLTSCPVTLVSSPQRLNVTSCGFVIFTRIHLYRLCHSLHIIINYKNFSSSSFFPSHFHSV